MSSVNSVRVPGLATGMDTDQMIKDMLVGEQSKVDKAKQKEQITKWQQESYRDIIKNVKGLYDKYFSATSPDFILSSKVFSTVMVSSSNSGVISAVAQAGANKVDYKFKVEQMAKAPTLESKKIDKKQTLGEQSLITGDSSNIKINGEQIELKSTDTINDVVKKINDKFPNGDVKATYSEMTGKLTIEGNKTGESSKLSFEGEFFKNTEMIDNAGSNVSKVKLSKVESKIELDKDDKLIDKGISTGKVTINGKEIEITDKDTVTTLVDKINKSESGVKATYDETTKKIKLESKEGLDIKGLDGIIDSSMISVEETTENSITGSNNKVIVYANDGKTELNTIIQEKNSFTVDNVTYNVNGINPDGELVSMSSTTDTKQTVDKIQSFLNDYNKMMDDIYKTVTEKKNKDYPPLTEAQKEDMSEEEIEKWEKKSKEGMLRNDKELRAFMEDIKRAIFSPMGDLGTSLSDIGIKSDDDYNKPGQLHLDVDKFTKSLEENGELVYKVTTGAFEKIKDVTYKYAGSSGSIFVKKAGMEKTSTAVNNLFSEQLKKQEDQIKNLTRKMKDKEASLYKKFAKLESNMSKLNSQMSYLMSSMGM